MNDITAADNPLRISRIAYEQLAEPLVDGYAGAPNFDAVEEGFRRWRGSDAASGWLTVDEFARVARPDEAGRFRRVEMPDDVRRGLEASRREVDDYLERRKLVYGVTTGFGAHRRHLVRPEEAERLSVNILYSHATGVGRPLPTEVVRGMMLSRLWTFAQARSGVSPHVAERLLEMLNAGVVPYVPEKGSVGCSGDLCSLAHLSLVLIGAGQAWLIPSDREAEWAGPSWRDGIDSRECRLRGDSDRKRLWDDDARVLLTGREALELAGIEPLLAEKLRVKDGLALTNGVTLSSTILALAVHDAEILYRTANLSGSLTHQAIGGHTRAYEPHVGAVRPHAGQLLTAWEMWHLLRDGNLKNRCALVGEAQDDYSVRSIPAVHGAARGAIAQARRTAEIELNAATDNPLLFRDFRRADGGRIEFQFGDAEDLPPDRKVDDSLRDTYHCSASNFHGEPVAIALDLLKIAVAELGGIAERRVQLLLDGNHNRGLPASLALGTPGLESGFMVTQYAAASLAADSKVLCHPSSVDSIPTSSNAEDHVSMAANAARHARQVVENTADVLAIEVLCGLQALDIRTTEIGPWLLRQFELAQKTKAREQGLAEPPALPDAAAVKHFMEERLGENAVMLFPNWRRREEVQEVAELLDTTALQLSSAAQRLLRRVRAPRQEGGLGIPMIVGDGPSPSGDDSFATFQHFPPSQLIETLASAIRSSRLLKAAW